MTEADHAARLALVRLTSALGRERGPVRASEARAAAHALAALKGPLPWLPGEDVAYYSGVALQAANEYDTAAGTLVRVGPASICRGEACWLLGRIVAARLTPQNEATERPRLIDCYRAVAAACPRSPLVRTVAGFDSDQAAARAGGATGPVVLPVVVYGRRFDWQRLVAVAEAYEKLDLMVEAAETHVLSAQVRDPDLWLAAGIEETWIRVARCRRARGENRTAARFLAKCFAVPLPAAKVSHLSAELEELLTAEPVKAKPHRVDMEALVAIGNDLLDMELFEEAVQAWRRAEAAGAPQSLRIAAAHERKARFLEDYRAERGPHTMLFGQPLTWQVVTKVWGEARFEYSRVSPAGKESAAGLERCNEAVARLAGRR